jgi:hypothetical protein
MERDSEKNGKLKKEIDDRVDQYLDEARQLHKKLKMKEYFGFNELETKIFEISLAKYILSKGSYEAAYFARSPEGQELAKIPIIGHIARQVIHINEVNNCAISELGSRLKTEIDQISPEEMDRPHSIINAANYLSTIYIECNDSLIRDFKKEFPEKGEYVRTKLLGMQR